LHLRFQLVELLLYRDFLLLWIGWRVCVHNLVMYYRNKNNGGEPPNEKS
jgi:hypothetical protein